MIGTRKGTGLAGTGAMVGLVAVAALIAANAVVAWIALGAVEKRLEPVIRDKAQVLAKSIGNDLYRAAALGIPVASLRGMDAWLEDLADDHPEVAYLTVSDPGGRVLSSAGPDGASATAGGPSDGSRPAPTGMTRAKDGGRSWTWSLLPGGASGYHLVHPLVHEGREIGSAAVGIRPDFVRNTMGGIFVDIGISLCVAVLIVLELTLLVLSLTVGRSIGLVQRLMRTVEGGDFSARAVARGRDDLARVIEAMNAVNDELSRRFRALAGRAGSAAADLREGRVFAERDGRYRALQLLRASDVQFPLFFFIFGVEITRPFFPLFVRDLYDPALGIDESIAIALPMSVWVVAMLFTTPFAPRAIRRLGTRNTLLLGMAPTSVGLIATAYATGFVELIAWRCATAAGFGLVSAAILVRLAMTAPERRRAFNVGMFVTATGGGSICGTALGGILAENLGYANTFIVGAFIVFVAMAIAFGFLSPEEGVEREAARPRRPGGRERFGIYASLRFMAFMSLSALPSRIVLTGFLFLLVPLHLDALGFGDAAIGRTLMVYFLVLLVMNQAAAFAADRFQKHGVLILAGGASAGAGCLLFTTSADSMALAAGVALIGLGQSLVMTPQVAVLPSYFRVEALDFGTGRITAAFRVVERTGSIAGPLIAGAVMAAAGVQEAGRVIGYGILATTAVLALMMASGVFSGRRRR